MSFYAGSADPVTVSDDIPSSLRQDGKAPDQFRDYSADTRDGVREFYHLNHQHQTLDFVLRKKAEYTPGAHGDMGVWEALEYLNQIVDDSDPDLDLPQIIHGLQTAEAIRRDGHPDWFVLTGMIHDMGKVLCMHGEPQWAVVGDTNPVGCAFSDKIVLSEYFAENPDSQDPRLNTANGIYEEHCGLDNMHLSWGHDEYLYQVVKDYMPAEACAMIRYHSAYVLHRENGYKHLLTGDDEETLKWVRAFNPYDLYTKSPVKPDVFELRPYYEGLINKYFPARIAW
ncbi:MAG: inositol oxygenase family protein [Blastocatellia bacterium]